uniref:RNA-directed DNA polymerase homolog n=1 Tax=Nicotiana tabacum TaxID=4097 RepID=A0A1S3ZLQ0_TOBAC|nr:PREDICTED: RNA-directed DNA polymerase homolog [Nicotiana tabacum]
MREGDTKEFEDGMPRDMPKRLSPKRIVDHEIELVLGAKPPAWAPYRMSQPELVELRRQLGGVAMFTKIDLKTSYKQVRIVEGDEHKMTCVTIYGSYDFLVMTFGLTNSPATFCTLMNQVFQEYIDKFIVVYLDDIMVYSKTLEEQLENLRKVLDRVRDHELYVKLSKCSFTQKQIDFLGHVIEEGRIKMDQLKI